MHAILSGSLGPAAPAYIHPHTVYSTLPAFTLRGGHLLAEGTYRVRAHYLDEIHLDDETRGTSRLYLPLSE